MRIPCGQAIVKCMGNADENFVKDAEGKQDAGRGNDDGLVGGRSQAVPGRYGEPIQVTHALYSRKEARANPARPLFILLHGWGSNEEDMADLMRYVAPYNDYISLRAPMVVPGSEEGMFGPGYTWFHDSRPQQADLDRDLYAAAVAVDSWVKAQVPEDRQVVTLGFSQGAALAVHLLRVDPERYRAAVCLSGFLAPAVVPGTAPADERLKKMDKPVFFGYGKADDVVPKYEIYALAAWLDEHSWLRVKGYDHLDHAVDMREFNDIRQWLADFDITSGLA